jgi:hypothetical protein
LYRMHDVNCTFLFLFPNSVVVDLLSRKLCEQKISSFPYLNCNFDAARVFNLAVATMFSNAQFCIPRDFSYRFSWWNSISIASCKWDIRIKILAFPNHLFFNTCSTSKLPYFHFLFLLFHKQPDKCKYFSLFILLRSSNLELSIRSARPEKRFSFYRQNFFVIGNECTKRKYGLIHIQIVALFMSLFFIFFIAKKRVKQNPTWWHGFQTLTETVETKIHRRRTTFKCLRYDDTIRWYDT